MLVDGEAMIKIADYKRINEFEFRQKNRQQAQRMHRTQGISRVRLNQDRLQIAPTVPASGRRFNQRRQNLLNPSFSGHRRPEPVMGGETEYPKEQLGIAYRGRLVQQDQAIHN